ncbi:MAG: hypothetical protein WAW80_03185 [Candidatus Saccharimonadales bacterium]
MNSTYIPGVCNIGPAEIRMRRMIGYIGLGITIMLFVIFYFVSIDSLLRLIVFLPASVGASGFLQAQLHFCARFGMSGLFNFSDDIRHQESVDQLEFRKKDQRKAVTIIFGSVVIGIVVATVAYLQPSVS